jgi:mannose-1-phosphate guanylyltransferase
MILHDYPRFNNVWSAETGQVQTFGAPPPGLRPSSPLAFTGIQVISPKIFDLIPPGVSGNIIDTYRQAIATGAKVTAEVRHNFFWQDIGTPQDYLEIHHRLLAGEVPGIAALYQKVTDPFLAEGVSLGTGTRFDGGVCLGPGVRVGAGVYLKNTVVWAEAVIDPGVRLEDCVVGHEVRVQRSARGECFQK